MNKFIKACSVINSCKTMEHNNVAYNYILLYEKQMRKVNMASNGHNTFVWSKQEDKIDRDVKALHEMINRNLFRVSSK